MMIIAVRGRFVTPPVNVPVLVQTEVDIVSTVRTVILYPPIGMGIIAYSVWEMMTVTVAPAVNMVNVSDPVIMVLLFLSFFGILKAKGKALWVSVYSPKI